MPHDALHARRFAPLSLGALVLALATAPAPAAWACDICAIYTGTLVQQEKTGLYLAVGEQYTDFGTVRTNGVTVPNPHHEYVKSSITQLVVGYSFTSWIGVQANVPLISREYRRVEGGEPVRGDASGLGDVSFVVRGSPFSGNIGEALLHVELLAGVKTPTGDSDRLAEELAAPEEFGSLEPAALRSRSPRHKEHESAVHGHDLALGSGSVDGIFGASMHGSWKRAFLAVQMQYALRGNGDFGYTYANDFTWQTGAGFYAITEDSHTAALQFTVSGEKKDKDVQFGMVSDDTATTAVYVGPGVSLTWKDVLTGQLTVDIPVRQDETETQIVADYRLRGGLTWRF